MKIGTKIAVGFAVLIALLLAVQIYQISIVHHMQRINAQQSEISFASALTALELLHHLEELDEFTQKYFVDPGFGSQLAPRRADFADGLTQIRQLSLGPREREEVEHLVRVWGEFVLLFQQVEDTVGSGGPSRELGQILPSLLRYFAELKARTSILIQEARNSVANEVAASREMSRQAEWISWTAAGTAVTLGFLVSFLIVRSISRQIRQLTRGTRRLAEGDFAVYVDDSGQDEIAQLARDFNAMVRRLKELDQLKKDFVSHVSHELKAPLASIRETTHLLLDRLPGELNPRQERLLELSLQSGRRLSAMIANLLDLSRMEAGAMDYEFEVQNLTTTVKEVVEELHTLCRDKQLTTEVSLSDEPVLARFDEERMAQVFRNLLVNAVSFSPVKGKITVRINPCDGIPAAAPAPRREQLAGGSSSFVLVSVSDQGPGVPDEHKERIFDKFHQIRRGKRRAGEGAGLGLAISLSIVEAHGGTIWVEDDTDRGSVFKVLLPAYPG